MSKEIGVNIKPARSFLLQEDALAVVKQAIQMLPNSATLIDQTHLVHAANLISISSFIDKGILGRLVEYLHTENRKPQFHDKVTIAAFGRNYFPLLVAVHDSQTVLSVPIFRDSLIAVEEFFVYKDDIDREAEFQNMHTTFTYSELRRFFDFTIHPARQENNLYRYVSGNIPPQDYLALAALGMIPGEILQEKYHL